MAGLDMMFDACADIQGYIEHQIRGLLEYPMIEYQDPNWVQAALLFERVVVPCEEYMRNNLYKLAEDIVKKAEQNNNRVIYQGIPRLYNEKIIDAKSVDPSNLPDDTEIRDYKKTIENIKKWMERSEIQKNELENLMKRTKFQLD